MGRASHALAESISIKNGTRRSGDRAQNYFLKAPAGAPAEDQLLVQFQGMIWNCGPGNASRVLYVNGKPCRVAPALVSEAMFALAQEQLEKNKRHSPRRTVEATLLQGMLVCEQCGYALWNTHSGGTLY